MFNRKTFISHLREQNLAPAGEEEKARQERIKKAQENLQKAQDERNQRDFGTTTPTEAQVSARSAAIRERDTTVSPERMARRAEKARHRDNVRVELTDRARARRGMGKLDPSAMIGTEASRQAAADAAGVAYVPRWEYGRGGQRLKVAGGGGAGGGGAGGGGAGGGGFMDTLRDLGLGFKDAASSAWQGVTDAASAAGKAVTQGISDAGAAVGRGVDASAKFVEDENLLGVGRPAAQFWANFIGRRSGLPGMATALGANKVYDLTRKTPTGPVVNPQAGPQGQASQFTQQQVQADQTLGQRLGVTRGSAQEVAAARGEVGTSEERLAAMEKLMAQGMSAEQARAELVRRGMIRATPKT